MSLTSEQYQDIERQRVSSYGLKRLKGENSTPTARMKPTPGSNTQRKRLSGGGRCIQRNPPFSARGAGRGPNFAKVAERRSIRQSSK